MNLQTAAMRLATYYLTSVFCLGPIAVKALVLTIVERLHANGWGMLYDGLPSDVTQVFPDLKLRRAEDHWLSRRSWDCQAHACLLRVPCCAGGIYPGNNSGAGLSARFLVLLDAPLAAQPAAIQAHPCHTPQVKQLLPASPLFPSSLVVQIWGQQLMDTTAC